ncbi:MAG TPA: CAP domain-containing protein [Solirubrobacterales bacterium]|nr:CAP domain-containing protein [Solirubrobacterales bacterium]
MSWSRRTLAAAASFAAAACVLFVGLRAGAAVPAALRAPCPGQNAAGAPAGAQEKTMLCLVNRARGQRGLDPLAAPASLARAAARKSADILRCDEFSHEACGREFTYWIEQVGYRGCREGENIAYGSGSYATPRSIFQMWMRSSGHRENILGAYQDTGIGLQVGRLEGHGGAHVWTQEFGAPC